MSDTYRVGAKLSVVVPPEPGPMSVVIDDQGYAWQHLPGPDVEQPWKCTDGRERAWIELVTAGALKLIHLGDSG